MLIKIEAVSNVIEMKPDHTYLLVFQGVQPHEAEQVLRMLRAVGINVLSVGLADGESVQVVELPPLPEAPADDDSLHAVESPAQTS